MEKRDDLYKTEQTPINHPCQGEIEKRSSSPDKGRLGGVSIDLYYPWALVFT